MVLNFLNAIQRRFVKAIFAMLTLLLSICSQVAVAAYEYDFPEQKTQIGR